MIIRLNCHLRIQLVTDYNVILVTKSPEQSYITT